MRRAKKPSFSRPSLRPSRESTGPTVYGCRPGNPFLYRIPATGQRPMTFRGREPAGRPALGRRGRASSPASNPPRGEYEVTLRAENDLGKAEKKFKIVSGDTLSLTPPMGWNTWYAYYDRVTDKLMREAADVMVQKRHGRRRLPVREHRRLLGERTEEQSATRSASARSATRRATSCPTSISPT